MDIDYKGTTHTFPDDWSQDKIRTALMKYDVMNPSTNLPKPPNAILSQDESQRPIGNSPGMTEGNIPSDSDVGRPAAAALPAVGAGLGSLAGGGGAYPGAVLGSAIKQGLQAASPENFGQAPTTPAGTIGQTALDTGLNAFLPGVIGKALNFAKNIPTAIAKKLIGVDNPEVQNWVQQNVGKFMKGTPEDAAELALTNVPQPAAQYTAKAGVQDLPDSLTGTAVGDLRAGKPLKSVVNKLYGDTQEAQTWKAATGEPYSVEQLTLNKLIKNNYTASNSRIDAKGILDELGGENKEFFGEALRPETQSNLEDFLNKAQELAPQKPSGGVGRTIDYINHRMIFRIGEMAAGGGIGGAIGHAAFGPIGGAIGGTAGLAGGIVLTESALTKLMSSPTMGKLAIQALDTPANTEVSGVLSKALLTGLKGATVYMQTPEGKLEKAQVSDQGQITYPPNK